MIVPDRVFFFVFKPVIFSYKTTMTMMKFIPKYYIVCIAVIKISDDNVTCHYTAYLEQKKTYGIIGVLIYLELTKALFAESVKIIWKRMPKGTVLFSLKYWHEMSRKKVEKIFGSHNCSGFTPLLRRSANLCSVISNQQATKVNKRQDELYFAVGFLRLGIASRKVILCKTTTCKANSSYFTHI